MYLGSYELLLFVSSLFPSLFRSFVISLPLPGAHTGRSLIRTRGYNESRVVGDGIRDKEGESNDDNARRTKM